MGIKRQIKLPEECALQVTPLTLGGARLQHVVRLQYSLAFPR